MTAQTPEKNRQTQMARLPHDTREGNSTLCSEHCATVVKGHNVSVFMQPFSASRLLHSKSTFHSANTHQSSTVARNSHHIDGFAHTANTMLHWNRVAFDNKPFTPFLSHPPSTFTQTETHGTQAARNRETDNTSASKNSSDRHCNFINMYYLTRQLVWDLRESLRMF